MQTITHNLNLTNTKYSKYTLEQNSHLFNDNDWRCISLFQSLSEPFIDKYRHKLDWHLISQYQSLSEHFIHKYYNKVNWSYISAYQKLSEPFIEKYQHNLDWYNISQYQSLSISFIKKHKYYIKWYQLFFNQIIPLNSKLLFAAQFNWCHLCDLSPLHLFY